MSHWGGSSRYTITALVGSCGQAAARGNYGYRVSAAFIPRGAG